MVCEMTKTRSEVYDERRTQILQGALKVFAAKGFSKATNKDIAVAAGIQSPGLIYHYFENKEALLLAVIEQFAPPLQVLSDVKSFLDVTPEQALTHLGMAYLKVMEDPFIGACMRVLIGEAVRSPKFAHILAEALPLRIWRLLAEYLQTKMNEGVLRQTDAAIAARCFIGPLATLAIRRTILQIPDDMDVDPQTLVNTHVTIFLRGVQRTPEDSAS
jgi:TetR/AcrR family transcriptional regulator, mexJK operon transcriptional repressor